MAIRTSVPLIASLAVASLALLLQLVALSTPNWFSIGNGRSGLWRECRGSICADIDIQQVSSKFGAARAFSLLGFFAGAASVALMIAYMFVKDIKLILIGATVSAGTTAFFLMVSFAAYINWLPANIRSFISWSFGLCVAAFVLFLVQTALLVYVLVSDREDKETDK